MISKEKSVFYHIYPLGFCGAPEKNDPAGGTVDRLDKIRGWIPHMRSLGANALYLGPVFESLTHGYDTTDPYAIDRRLGDREGFKDLVRELHSNGIDVVLDAVFNHVGRAHFAFRDIVEKGRDSRFCGWFAGVDFSKRSPYGDPFTYDTWAGHYELVKLNLRNPEVIRYLLDAAEYWIGEFDIDGLRLDAADSLDFDFMRALAETTKRRKPGFWLMGEVVHGDYSRWVRDGGLDSTTNYECYKGLYSSHNDANYFEIAWSLRRQFADGGIYMGIPLYNFADNHDVDRVSSKLADERHLYPLYILLFTMPGVPSVYYGSEWGIDGRKGGAGDRELRPGLEELRGRGERGADLSKHLSCMSEIRRGCPALGAGGYRELFVRHEQFGFAREHDGESVVVMVNSESREALVDGKFVPAGIYTDLLNGGETVVAGSGGEINLYPGWGRVLRKRS